MTKITLKSDDWKPGQIEAYPKHTISASCKSGSVNLVYEIGRGSFTFLGVERVRSDPASQFAGDLPAIVEHLPWTAVPKATWLRIYRADRQRRSYFD